MTALFARLGLTRNTSLYRNRVYRLDGYRLGVCVCVRVCVCVCVRSMCLFVYMKEHKRQGAFT